MRFMLCAIGAALVLATAPAAAHHARLLFMFCKAFGFQDSPNALKDLADSRVLIQRKGKVVRVAGVRGTMAACESFQPSI